MTQGELRALMNKAYARPCVFSRLWLDGDRARNTELGEMSPHILLAFSRERRQAAFKGQYVAWYLTANCQIDEVAVEAVIGWMKRSCAAPAIPPLDLTGLEPDDVLDALDLANELGVNANLLQVPIAVSRYVARHRLRQGQKLRGIARKGRYYEVMRALRACGL